MRPVDGVLERRSRRHHRRRRDDAVRMGLDDPDVERVGEAKVVGLTINAFKGLPVASLFTESTSAATILAT